MKKDTGSLFSIIAFVVVIGAIAALFFLNGNRQIIDINNNFSKCTIAMPDGTILSSGVRSWKDYEGEQIQVTLTDGRTLLVNSMNIVLET